MITTRMKILNASAISLLRILVAMKAPNIMESWDSNPLLP